MVSVAVTTATLGILVWLVLHHHLSLAAAGAAVLAIRLLTTSIQQLFSGVSGLFESSLFIKDLEIFLNRDELELEPVDRGGNVAPLSDLRVENVWFAYPGTSRYVLRNLSLSIRAGEIVAVVGENGSGKTTWRRSSHMSSRQIRAACFGMERTAALSIRAHYERTSA